MTWPSIPPMLSPSRNFGSCPTPLSSAGFRPSGSGTCCRWCRTCLVCTTWTNSIDGRRLPPVIRTVGCTPSLGFPGGDDLRDRCHKKQLTEDCFQDGEGLPRIGGRHQIAVPGGGEGDEAEKQHLSGITVTRCAEKWC